VNGSIVSRRYASALFAVAERESLAAGLKEALESFSELLAGSDDLRHILHSPRFHTAEKKNVVAALIGEADDETHALLHRFLDLLIDKHRIEWFDEILSDFSRIEETSRGISRAHVTTAGPLAEALKDRLETVLGKLTGGRVFLEFTEDPAILGGIVISIEGKVIDASVKYRLDMMREHLKSVRVH